MITTKPHTQTVEGIGAFTWRIPRTMRDEIRIAAEVSRMIEGVETPSRWLSSVSEMQAALKVLTVEAPAGWNLDDMDPLDPETYWKLSEVFGAMRATEDGFRRERRERGQTRGQGDGGDSAAVVPA